MDPRNESNTIINENGIFHEIHTCFPLPPKINSMGILKYLDENRREDLDILGYSMPNLLLQIAVIFFLTQGFNFLLKRMGLPVLISQILAGLIFNPATVAANFSTFLFTKDSIEVLGTVATIGVQFFMFQSGVKMDVDMLKHAGGKVIFIGLLGVSLPLLLSLATITTVNGEANLIDNFFTTTIYSMTSFPAIEFLLNELKLLNSELGRLSLSTALVSDLFSLVLIFVSSLLRIAHHNPSDADDGLISVISFICFVGLIIRPTLKFVVGKISDGMLVKDVYIYVIIAVFLGSVFLAHFYGLFVLYGPFMIGLAVPTGPPLGSVVLKKLEIVSDFFLPLFVSTCAMRVNFETTHFEKIKLGTIAIVVTVIALAKFLACFLSHSHFWKMPANDAAAFALIMSAKGAVELALYSFFNDTETVMDYAFVFMVGVVVVFSIIIPIIVRKLYNPAKRFAQYQKRNLMDSSLNSELKIVTCIHVPGDVTAIIKLLEVSCGGDTQLEVNVLHLIKLVAQSTPLFISHRRERTILCDYSYSINVIRLLNEFEQHNQGSVSVNAITAVSPPSFMYDDICTVALDKVASLVILPFHIRWCYQDGSIESEDHVIRELNGRVLDRAPCTIGILVDRYHNPKRSSYRNESPSRSNIAMIFLGGSDDREALSFAIRMAQDTKVSLCVLHLTATIDNDNDNGEDVNYDIDRWELKRDELILGFVKDQEYITYKEEVANDATTTASIVRSMVNEYELIVVGRRNNVDNRPQTAGLEEWCEFPELGELGDLILSTDTNCTCSIFVVQQQRQ